MEDAAWLLDLSVEGFKCLYERSVYSWTAQNEVWMRRLICRHPAHGQDTLRVCGRHVSWKDESTVRSRKSFMVAKRKMKGKGVGDGGGCGMAALLKTGAWKVPVASKALRWHHFSAMLRTFEAESG